MNYETEVKKIYPNAYIKEVDRYNVGGLGVGAPRSFFQVRVPRKFLIFNYSIVIGESYWSPWRDAYEHLIEQGKL